MYKIMYNRKRNNGKAHIPESDTKRDGSETMYEERVLMEKSRRKCFQLAVHSSVCWLLLNFSFTQG